MPMSPQHGHCDHSHKLVNSNEKLEKRYKEIIKENDGRLFEVHQKKGSGSLHPGSSMNLMRNSQGYPFMLQQVL